MIDEGYPLLGRKCSSGLGECAAEGAYVCNENGDGVTCSAVEERPVDEVCGDCLDNDCDGSVDEDCNDICIDNDSILC